MAENSTQVGRTFRSEILKFFKSAPTIESVASEASEIHRAAVTGDRELLKLTISSKHGDINLQDDWGHTAMYIAAQKGHSDMVALLLSHGAKLNVTEDDSLGDTNPMHCVRDEATAEILIKAGGDMNAIDLKGNSPLHRAVMREDISILALLLEHGANVNIQNNEGCTALHICCNSSGSDNMVEAMKNIISHGGDVNSTDYFGMTPLHYLAKWQGSKLSVKTLVSAGADLHIQDYRGSCPVHYFRLYFEEEEHSFIETLREFFPSPETANVTDFRGHTALHINTDTSANVVEKLIEWGCQVTARDNHGETALHVASSMKAWKNKTPIVEVLLKKGGHVNERDDSGRSSLQLAAKSDDDVVVKLLISYNAGVNACDMCGISPLHEAALKDNVTIVELLLHNGADVNIVDDNLSSPLHFAAWGNCENVAKLLISHGANVKSKDKLGHTPLVVAKFKRAENVVTVLGKYTSDDIARSEDESDNVYALSNCGGKFLPLDTVSQMIKNKKITRKGYQELQPYLTNIIESTEIGRGCDDDEAKEIQLAMEDLVQTLAKIIGTVDWRFRCKVIHAGSTSEGTKTRCPDEFDFIFALEEFSEHCNPSFSDIDSKSHAELNLPAYPSRKTEKLDARADCNESEISVSVSDYAKMIIDSTTDAEAFIQFSGSTTMPVHKMYDGFSQLLTKVLFSQEFPKHPKLRITGTTIDPEMTLCWRGCRYKDLEISADLVPAIILKNWPEQFDKEHILLTQDIQRLCSLAVPKMTSGTDVDLWRCSLALGETAIFRKLKPAVRNSYIACKALVNSSVCPQLNFGGYNEAMVQFRIEHDSVSSEEEVEIYERVETIVPSYMLKMMFLAAVEDKAKESGLESVYMDNTENPDLHNIDQSEDRKEPDYGPAEVMYVAEKCYDLDVPLVLDVYRKCDECIKNQFVPSFFNRKHNVLGARVMAHDKEKVAIYVNFIRTLLEHP